MNPAGTTLGHRQLFILPSRHGLMFTVLLFVMLLLAINYENGLVYGITFLLGSMGVTSLIYTQRNLYRLTISANPPPPCFAGDDAVFTLTVSNNRDLPRYSVVLETLRRRRVGGIAFAQVNVGRHETAYAELSVPAQTRGYLKLPPLLVSSTYPLGLAYCWSRRIELEERCLVYPCPFGQRPLPQTGGEVGQESQGLQGEGDDFHGLREYRRGDPPGHIAWKALARGQGMYTKQFTGGTASVWLDWAMLPGLDTEGRLSQLCSWLLEAEQQGLRYGLRLPDQQLAPAHGPEHEHRCLKALALFARAPA